VSYSSRRLAGTRAYYSGTQGDCSEMGLYGAIIVLPATPPTCANANWCGKRP